MTTDLSIEVIQNNSYVLRILVHPKDLTLYYSVISPHKSINPQRMQKRRAKLRPLSVSLIQILEEIVTTTES